MGQLDDHTLEEIENYLSGELTDEQLRSFNERLSSDKAFAEQVEIFREVKEGVKSYYFKNQIAKNKSKFEKTGGSTSFYWAVAASVILLIGFSFWFNKESQPQDLFAENFTPYPYLGAPRGETGNKDMEELAFQAYQRNDFSDATEKFQNLLVTKPNNDQYLFYLGNSYLSNKEFDPALQVFSLISDNSIYYQNSKWYIALSYLGLNENEKAKAMLESIDDNSKLGTKAKDLLDDIK